MNMGRGINGDLTDKFAGISPDGNYIFWVSHRELESANPERVWEIEGVTMPVVQFEGGDIYWVISDVVERYRDMAPADR
ncbi:MAG TPA: hypothetical protein VLA34_08750 [Candidatus Krumholzibacterium sp.]|nr:hypothetical protein [Candidatus Krumholzibacterium sp.]